MSFAEIVLKNLDPWIAQEPDMTPYQLAMLMSDAVDRGVAKFYRHGDSVFYVVRITPWVADLHLFSEEKSYRLIKNIRHFLDQFWAETEFIKLLASFHLEKLCAVAEKSGFDQEGLIKKSHMLPDGKLADKYIYGASKWAQ